MPRTVERGQFDNVAFYTTISSDLTNGPYVFVVGTGGNVKFDTNAGDTVTATYSDGDAEFCQVTKIYASGTTAGNIRVYPVRQSV